MNIILIILLISLSLLLGVSCCLTILFVKDWTPKKLCSRIGLIEYNPIDWTLFSWSSSLEQLSFDADIVFIGDSLTRGENFQDYFKEKKILNLGLSGDTIQGISNRCYLIKKFKPKMIFIEGGVNSLASNSIDEVSSIYEHIVSGIVIDNPSSQIYIQSVLPISSFKEVHGLTNENILKLNIRLKSTAAKLGVEYIDIYSLYVLNGEMNPQYTSDGIHIKEEYRYFWTNKLADYIK